MQLYKFLNEFVRPGEKILVYMELDAGTPMNFSVEVMRGQSCHRWREEYGEWLNALHLEVASVSAVRKDVAGNEDMLCIKCMPIEINQERNGKDE